MSVASWNTIRHSGYNHLFRLSFYGARFAAKVVKSHPVSDIGRVRISSVFQTPCTTIV